MTYLELHVEALNNASAAVQHQDSYSFDETLHQGFLGREKNNHKEEKLHSRRVFRNEDFCVASAMHRTSTPNVVHDSAEMLWQHAARAGAMCTSSLGEPGNASHPYALHHAVNVVVQLQMSGSSDHYIVQSMPLEELLAVYLPLVEELVNDGFTELAQGRFDLWQAHVDGLQTASCCVRASRSPPTADKAAKSRQEDLEPSLVQDLLSQTVPHLRCTCVRGRSAHCIESPLAVSSKDAFGHTTPAMTRLAL